MPRIVKNQSLARPPPPPSRSRNATRSRHGRFAAAGTFGARTAWRFPGERSLSLGTPGLPDERPVGLGGTVPHRLGKPCRGGKFRGGFCGGMEDDQDHEHGSLDPELVFVACRRARGAGGQALCERSRGLAEDRRSGLAGGGDAALGRNGCRSKCGIVARGIHGRAQDQS